MTLTLELNTFSLVLWGIWALPVLAIWAAALYDGAKVSDWETAKGAFWYTAVSAVLAGLVQWAHGRFPG